MHVREPAVAGMFYPENHDILRQHVRDFLQAVEVRENQQSPKALIVPHAGYIYSGPIAARAYALVRPENISRVVLLGPAHRVLVPGMALPDEQRIWRTPLGEIPIDEDALDRVGKLDQVLYSDVAHAAEHSLEVQLPFLQVLLKTFSLVPIVVGNAAADTVAAVLGSLWGGPETLVVISSDLSHYEPYEQAVAKDSATALAILDSEVRSLSSDCACGLRPIAGLSRLARSKNLRVEQVDLRNSGDTAGPRDQVVGYGAFAYYEECGQ